MKRKRTETTNGCAERIRNALKIVISELVDHPEDSDVELMISASGDILVLTVKTREGEAGQVIGKKGSHAGALRLLAEAMASKHGLRAVLEVPK